MCLALTCLWITYNCNWYFSAVKDLEPPDKTHVMAGDSHKSWKDLRCIFLCWVKSGKDVHARHAGNPTFAMWPSQFRFCDFYMWLAMNVGCCTMTGTSRKGEVKDLNPRWSARHTWIVSPYDWTFICREMYIRLHHASDLIFILLMCSGCSMHWYFTV